MIPTASTSIVPAPASAPFRSRERKYETILGLQPDQDLPLLLANRVDPQALLRLRALAAAKVELVGVQRADHLAGPDDAFGERPLLVRAAVLRGEELAVALPEDGDLLARDDEAEALALRDLL